MNEHLQAAIDAIREAQMHATDDQYSKLDDVMFAIQDIMED